MNYDCSITNKKGCNYCLRNRLNSRDFSHEMKVGIY